MEKTTSIIKKPISRRDFIKIASLFGLDLFLGAILGWNYIDKIEPNWVEVTNVRLKLPRLPGAFSGYRIVQISDIHAGYWMTPERFASIVELVKDQSPDLVAVTGDIILAYGGMSRNKPVLDRFVEVFKNITDNYATIAVLGNHDYWYDADKVQAALEGVGARVLMNSVHSLERGGKRLHIAGIDDVYEDHDDLDAVLAALPQDGGAILLAHEPDFADRSAATGRFDLQISGHSHGGQVALPLIGPLVLPYLGQKYPSGLYKVGDMYQYTNRGIGMTPPTVRFNCRPEITVFTLESI
jgi:predicted MPP superfamily phosphohydrolase